jgi:hypothetical protein
MENVEIGIVFSLAGFVLGWIGSEAYQFYKDSKDRRWKS